MSQHDRRCPFPVAWVQESLFEVDQVCIEITIWIDKHQDTVQCGWEIINGTSGQQLAIEVFGEERELLMNRHVFNVLTRALDAAGMLLGPLS